MWWWRNTLKCHVSAKDSANICPQKQLAEVWKCLDSKPLWPYCDAYYVFCNWLSENVISWRIFATDYIMCQRRNESVLIIFFIRIHRIDSVVCVRFCDGKSWWVRECFTEHILFCFVFLWYLGLWGAAWVFYTLLVASRACWYIYGKHLCV